MASWATKRKILYGGSVIFVVLAIVFIIIFSFFYKAPTCFDNIKNSDEQGIDCGGSCVKLCQSAFLPLKISWGGAKFEKIAPRLYNLASYIVNPNTTGGAINVPYKFSLFDSKGILIIERTGKVNIGAHRNTLAFLSGVDVSERIPAKAVFEFTEGPVWFKSSDSLNELIIVDKKYEEDDKSSFLNVTFENKGLKSYRNLIVGVVLYDENNNAIGFSQTKIDAIYPKTETNNNREIAAFTWPVTRNGKVTSIEALPIITPEKAP